VCVVCSLKLIIKNLLLIKNFTCVTAEQQQQEKLKEECEGRQRERGIRLKQLALEATMPTAANALASFAFPSLLVLADLAYERVECIVDAHSRLGGGLNERHAVLFRNVARLIHVDGPRLKITFVANQHHWYFLSILNSLYLFTICS